MDDFDRLFADLPRRGRRADGPALSLTPGRALVEADADAIAEGGVAAIVSPLTRLRHTHHELARLIAEGRPGVEVSAITGKSQSWISTLRSDPAFAELVAYYASQKDAVYLDVHARLAGLGTDAVNELQHRLDTDPDRLTAREVLEIAEMALDRSVAPAKSAGPGSGTANGTAVAVNVTFVTSGEAEDATPAVVDLAPNGRGGFG